MNRNVTYPKEIKLKAKQMYESGTTFAKIASILNIKRMTTVFDWSVKYGWKKNNISNSKFIFCTDKDIKDLEKAGRKAIKYLLDEANEYKSNTEAVKVLESVRAFLDIAYRSSDNYEEDLDTSEKKKEAKNIFKLLDIKEKKTEKKKK